MKYENHINTIGYRKKKFRVDEHVVISIQKIGQTNEMNAEATSKKKRTNKRNAH